MVNDGTRAQVEVLDDGNVPKLHAHLGVERALREAVPLELEDDAEQLRVEDRVVARRVDGVHDELQRGDAGLARRCLEQPGEILDRDAHRLKAAARHLVEPHLYRRIGHRTARSRSIGRGQRRRQDGFLAGRSLERG